MSNRINISSGSPFEDTFGYCRAVKTGNLLEISGTVALVDGEKITADDLYAQTYNIIERIAVVLEEAGSSLKDVVRTRIFTTDIIGSTVGYWTIIRYERFTIPQKTALTVSINGHSV